MTKWIVGFVALGGVAVFVLVMAVALSDDTTTDVTDLSEGYCFDLDLEPDADSETAELGLVEVIDCDEPHNAQVISVVDLNPDADLSYPDDVELFGAADAACADGGIDDDRFGILPIAPTPASWEARRGRTVCVALAFGGSSVTGDHARFQQG